MSPPPLDFSPTGLPAVDRVVRQLVTQLRALLGAPFLSGVQLSGVLVGPGTTQITHGLGRTPIGYLVTRQGGPLSWVSWDARQLSLSSPSAVVADLWVW